MDAKLKAIVKILVDKKTTEQKRADTVRLFHDRKKDGDAIPPFLEALETGTPAVKTFVLRAIALVLNEDAKARKTYAEATIAACMKVATTKPKGKTDYPVQDEAGRPLGAVGLAAIDKIEELAGHADVAARGAAFNAVYWFHEGDRAKAAKRLFAVVEGGLAHQEIQTRRDAAFAPHTWGPLAGPLVPPLVKRLDDEDEHVRDSALGTLGEIGPAAASAIPKLIELSKDKNHVVSCVMVLGDIGQDTKEIRAAFKAAEKLDPEFVPDAAKEALAKFAKAKKKKKR